jgi:glycerol-3-phosphate dehydrogenase
MPASHTTDVLVIGGGATGTGLLRDLAMRGIRATLVERRDLADGTTGRYHGLLHSGARYVQRDAEAARDCARENAILRRIIPHCLEDTGGLFVSTPHDPKRYAEDFVRLCYEAGVPAHQVRLRDVRRREPALHPHISHAFEVADGAADAFLTVEANVRSAREYGAQCLLYHEVVALHVAGGRVGGATLRSTRTGEETTVECACVINAAGAWAGQIGRLAGVAIDIVAGKGVMIALNHRLVNTVINRCKPPGDGDILVPIRTVCVAGTTDESVPDPDDRSITAPEVALILEEGDKLVPGLSRARLLRAWAGVRPLYREQADGDQSRDLSRDFKVLDHARRDGLGGLVSIVGGKYTTYRLMAERAVDVVAAQLGVTAPCLTHVEVIPPPDERRFFTAGTPLASVEAEHSYGDLVCECELVTRERVLQAWREGATSIDDVRRDTRLGMGPCQGGFCTNRAAALRCEVGIGNRESGIGGQDSEVRSQKSEATDPRQPLSQAGSMIMDASDQLPATGHRPPATGHGSPITDIQRFLAQRWRGVHPILWGDQLRQARLDEQIYWGLLNVEGQEGAEERAEPAER